MRRRLAVVGAAAAFLLAGYTAMAESMPELRIYDGYWMLLGAAVAVAAVGTLVWRWPRQRSLIAVVAAAIVGAWAPILWLALRGHVAIMPRLRGTWHLMGGDVVGAAIAAGVACLWIALRAPGTSRPAGS